MYIDTHTHIDAEEFDIDREETIERAMKAGASHLLVPAIDLKSSLRAAELCQTHAMLRPMAGLHPEEVKADWQEQLSQIRVLFTPHHPYIAIGEIGLDYYWSREFEKEQLAAFEQQVEWASELQLPLMLHCRKAQNEMVAILRRYEKQLTRGGVFHCFTGNAMEARQLLDFPRFVLGIGGVLTFKKSHLPETLAEAVPIERIVLETDSPYMAPVPMRGQRNESSFVPYIIQRLAEVYAISTDEVERITSATAKQMFAIE